MLTRGAGEFHCIQQNPDLSQLCTFHLIEKRCCDVHWLRRSSLYTPWELGSILIPSLHFVPNLKLLTYASAGLNGYAVEEWKMLLVPRLEAWIIDVWLAWSPTCRSNCKNVVPSKKSLQSRGMCAYPIAF